MSEKSWTSISSSHLFYMRIIGLIPFKDTNFDDLSSRLCTFLYHVMNITYNSMLSGYGVRKFPKIFNVDYMCEIIIVQAVFFRYLVFYVNRARIAKLVDSCRKLWSYLRNNENEVMLIFERRANFLRNVVLIDGISVTSLYIITSLFIDIPAKVARNETKELIFKYWADVREEPDWTIVTCWQTTLSYYIPVEIAAMETVGLFLILMASGYLRVLQERLYNLNERFVPAVDDSNEFHSEVLQCVQYHQDIMRFCKDIEYVTRKAFFVVVLTSTYNLSITGIKILDVGLDEIAVLFQYITLLFLNLFTFFIAQYGPEFLLTKSEAVGDAAYFAALGQSTFQPRANKMLFFMMMRTQQPIQLTAGGFIKLSIETFGIMLKSAFSFFALLRSFRE